MMKHGLTTLVIGSAAVLLGPEAAAQSSSLYNTTNEEMHERAKSRYDLHLDRSRRHLPDVNPAVPRLTMFVSRRPEPRDFKVNDLVTVIVRESFESEMDAEKSTEKSTEVSGGVNAIPPLRLSDLLNLQVNGTSTPSNPITLDVGFERTREGEGEYERTESMTGRVRARIIDIKPNGMLVLEARRTIINDGEQSLLVATGNCMPEDITANNTVESSQLENLFIDKQHSGDLRDSGEKGWITRIIDTVFDF